MSDFSIIKHLKPEESCDICLSIYKASDKLRVGKIKKGHKIQCAIVTDSFLENSKKATRFSIHVC